MEESKIEQNKKSAEKEEIDILEVGSQVWYAFRKLFIGIKDLISFIIILLKDITVSIIIFMIRKSLWIVSFALTGMILGFVFYNAIKPSFLFTCEGETGGIDNSVVIDHVNRLDLLKGDTVLLAKYLNISNKQAKEIRSIKACYGIDLTGDGKPNYIDFTGKRYNDKDSMQTRLPSFVHFRVSLYDRDMLPVVREGLFNYIKNNAYIKDLYQIDRQMRENLIKGLDKEIERLDKIDSVQRERISGRNEVGAEKGQLVLLNGSEPEIRLLYDDILSLFNQREQLQRHVDLIKEPVLIVQDFIPVQLEERPLIWYFLRFGGFMALLGILCAMIWQYHKKIWEMIKEDSGQKILEHIREDATKYKSEV